MGMLCPFRVKTSAKWAWRKQILGRSKAGYGNRVCQCKLRNAALAAVPAKERRRYCVGEQTMIRLNAVLNVLSDSYPSEKAMAATFSLPWRSRSAAISMRHCAR